MRIAVLNGVNLDVLDRRDAVHYGGLTLADLESRIYAWSKEFTCTTRCRQTNHEGQFVDWCHDALDWADGVILNPGAWSHYSYAIRDAVELFKVPVVEVHLSKIEGREEWRRTSVISDLATKRVSGEGPEGYRSRRSRSWRATIEPDRAARRAPRRTAPRHERDQRPLPHRALELERRPARRLRRATRRSSRTSGTHRRRRPSTESASSRRRAP